MEAKELRIGNYVDWNGEKAIISQLLEKDVCFKCGEDCLYEDINPIPLTEDWLINFGFDYRFTKGKFNILTKGRLGYENGRTYFNSWAILEKQPDYVHELQNLYYAITKEELILNNK